MSSFQITLKEKITPAISCFIPHPSDEEGGGWTHNVTIGDDSIWLDSGNIQKEYVPAVIKLLEEAERTDTSRMEEYGSTSLASVTYFEEEEDQFHADAEAADKVEVGITQGDMWVAHTGVVNKRRKNITTVTLLRVANRYVVLHYGIPSISFECWELEGITALIQASQEYF